MVECPKLDWKPNCEAALLGKYHTHKHTQFDCRASNTSCVCGHARPKDVGDGYAIFELAIEYNTSLASDK